MSRKFTPAQEAVLEYFRNDAHRDELEKIVEPNIDGAKIKGTELRKVFEKLGYHDAGFSNYSFIDELVKMYTRAEA